MVELNAEKVRPVLEPRRAVGVRVGGQTFRAAQIIDAAADGDFAAEAGAAFTLGFRSLGVDARMADTLVFQIDGVDWDALRAGARAGGAGVRAGRRQHGLGTVRRRSGGL